MKQNAYFERLRGRDVLVLGLGVSNRPLMRLLLQHGAHVTGCDRTPRDRADAELLAFEAMGATLRLGEDYLSDLNGDVAFRTPGLHPALPQMQALRASGCHITSEMEAFFEVCPCPIIGVTGSDGKTTTTTLIAQMLRQAGRHVWLGGNIGTPLLDRADEMTPPDLVVLELSSFQLMHFPFSPHISIVTNLAPNHLDIHRDMDEYVAAKQNIFLHQHADDTLILNHDNAITRAFAAQATGTVREFSRLEMPEHGVYLQNDTIFRTSQPVLSRQDILLPGLHNVENYMAAMLAVEGLASDEDIRSVARSFTGVEHRIELVRSRHGVRFYNDSIASSPSRTIAGLRSFTQRVILIAGGYDKHLPFDELGVEICKHVKTLVCTGATGPKIAAATRSSGLSAPEILEVDDFFAAVDAATTAAQPGDIVLLSPAGAAFDRFQNFMVRGNAFKRHILELPE